MITVRSERAMNVCDTYHDNPSNYCLDILPKNKKCESYSAARGKSYAIPKVIRIRPLGTTSILCQCSWQDISVWTKAIAQVTVSMAIVYTMFTVSAETSG